MIYAALCVLAFLMFIGFVLIVAGWCENAKLRRDAMAHLDADRERVTAALAASHRYMGRAWLPGESSTSAPQLRAGARRGAPEGTGAEVVPFVRRARSSSWVVRARSDEQTSATRVRSIETALAPPSTDAMPSLTLVPRPSVLGRGTGVLLDLEAKRHRRI